MNKINTLRYFLSERPANVICWKIWCKVVGATIKNKFDWLKLFAGRSGIEIGGPSGMFTQSGFLPIYPVVKSLDGVNFSSQTLWEEALQDGYNYKFDNKTGYQFISEGSQLEMIESGKYDFVLSCNNLEHIANPLKAVIEWKRIIRKDGIILLILPRKESNFDHKRSITTLDHLISDFENNTAEDDLSHLTEILEKHDLRRDPHAGSREDFRKRSEKNFLHRGLHHHVFDTTLLSAVGEWAELKTLLSFSSPTDHFVALSPYKTGG